MESHIWYHLHLMNVVCTYVYTVRICNRTLIAIVNKTNIVVCAMCEMCLRLFKTARSGYSTNETGSIIWHSVETWEFDTRLLSECVFYTACLLFLIALWWRLFIFGFFFCNLGMCINIFAMTIFTHMLYLIFVFYLKKTHIFIADTFFNYSKYTLTQCIYRYLIHLFSDFNWHRISIKNLIKNQT